MNKEEIEELMEYNLEYLEAVNSEEIFGGDYTSSVDLKYANKTIDKLQQENKQLKELYENSKIINEEHRTLNGMLRETINKAIEYINEEYYAYPKELTGLVDGDILLEILRGDSNE